MQLLNKKRGDTNTPNQLGKIKHSNCFIELQGLRDLALYYAIKYRFDPVLSKTHEEYLNALNELLEIEK